MTSKHAPHIDADKKPIPLRIWHCSHPRTASNVLAKQFRDHPQLRCKEYIFKDAFLHGPERQLSMVKSASIPNAQQATYQNRFDELRRFLTDTEFDGKTIFIKEHIRMILDPQVLVTIDPQTGDQSPVYCPVVKDLLDNQEALSGDSATTMTHRKTNPSVLPDSFMRTLSPILQIRHPALTVSSYYRVLRKSGNRIDLTDGTFAQDITFAWDRLIFDWYCDNVYTDRKSIIRGNRSWPLVVEGDDLLNENERVITAICELAQLDSKRVITEWQPVTEEAKATHSKNELVFLSTLQDSRGIVRSGTKQGEIDLRLEVEKWEEEFGEEVAEKLRFEAEAAMEDYLYLLQFKI